MQGGDRRPRLFPRRGLCYSEGMQRFGIVGMALLWLGVAMAAPAGEAALNERYGPAFYGLRLPETGARVLLVIDTSKSMSRKDRARADGGRRWDTLLDEVRTMTDEMVALVVARKVCFTVSLLYEGGETPHPGTDLFDMAQRGASGRLLAELSGKAFTAGGSFERTFGQTLWPLVARQHITHVIYLGDNDIARHGEAVREAVAAWYAVPKAEPEAARRPLWNLKRAWWKPWERWRRPVKGVPTFRAQQAYPPPPRDVVFSTVAIGQASPFLQALAMLGKGESVTRGGAAPKPNVPPKSRRSRANEE